MAVQDAPLSRRERREQEQALAQDGAHKVTGYSPAQQSLAVSSGMQVAREVRERWLASLTEGEVTFERLVDWSNREDEHRYLKSLRLEKILSRRRGWSRATAELALTRNGFKVTDTVQTIRSKPRLMDLFTDILATTADRWRARPQVPSGWPWNGKLELLVPVEALPPVLGGPPPAPTPFSKARSAARTKTAAPSAPAPAALHLPAPSTSQDEAVLDAFLDVGLQEDGVGDVEETQDAAALLFDDDEPWS